jgi:nitrogen fixation protein NifX
MKVAFTSSNGERIDEHFGMATNFNVWEVGPDDAEFVAEVAVPATGEDEEDRIAARAGAIADCAIVYTMQIGGPAAAKLVARRIHPMKTQVEVPIAEVIGRLQQVLKRNPPPWLRKAINRAEVPSLIEEE